jgi:RNA polymerase sigma-70 factor, ECF subfamily
VSTFGADLFALAPKLRRVALRWVPRDKVDDLMQETWERAWKARDRFQPGSNLTSWACVILKNLIHEKYRGLAAAAERRSVSLEESMGRLEEEGIEGNVTYEIDHEVQSAIAIPPRQEHHIALLQVTERMRRLSGPHAAAMGLVVGLEMDYVEAGRCLGLAPDIVKSQVHRARKILKGYADAD